MENGGVVFRMRKAGVASQVVKWRDHGYRLRNWLSKSSWKIAWLPGAARNCWGYLEFARGHQCAWFLQLLNFHRSHSRIISYHLYRLASHMSLHHWLCCGQRFLQKAKCNAEFPTWLTSPHTFNQGNVYLAWGSKHSGQSDLLSLPWTPWSP